jgi:16S rRNA (adenine1518-N6/adenine1519-N6)-dimethyltransferase
MSNPKQILHQIGIDPIKSLGQNFLHDPNTIEKIVDSAEIMPDDIVLEIGPGAGAITGLLAQRARQVFSIEVDERLRPILNSQLRDYDNVQVIFQDFLKFDVSALIGTQDFVVVANVPYYITSPIILQLLSLPHLPRAIVLTIQYEVAERIIAQPPDMNRLAVITQLYGTPSIVTKLSAAVFWPRPDVESAVIKIVPHAQPVVDVQDVNLFSRLVKAGFSQKRKQLRNSLSGGLGIKGKEAEQLLTDAGIQPQRRAETLSLDEWAKLLKTYQMANEK